MTTNIDNVAKVKEEFYGDLYCCRDNQGDNCTRMGPHEFYILPITTDEENKALEPMKSSKPAGEDHVTADLLKEDGQIFLELANLYTLCIMTSTVPESWNNANVTLIQMKGNVNDLKK